MKDWRKWEIKKIELADKKYPKALKKIRNPPMKKMAQVYLTEEGLGESACRIDVVGVWLEMGTDKVGKIKHWEDVQL